MGRKERRAALKAQQIENKANELWNERRKHYGEKAVLDEALEETVTAVSYQVSGELYTLFALVLRQAPYRWQPDKIMRLFDRVQSGIKMLDNKEYTVDQLKEDAEAWGFKVRYSVLKGSRKYISDIHAFEEEVEELEKDDGTEQS